MSLPLFPGRSFHGNGRSRRLLPAVAIGMALVAGACTSTPPAFDLTAPRQGLRGSGPGGTLVVTEPTALQPLESERILVKDATGSLSVLGSAVWADRLPRLVQARLIQTFENASRIRAVGRPGDGVVAQYQLNTELRAFQFEAGRGEVFVEISAKLLSLAGGQVVRARVFGSRVPVGSTNPAEITQALDRALSAVLLDIVRSGGGGGGGRA